jgi:hypothetical protein
VASGLRKASVLKQDLPPVIKIDVDEYGYLTRYRIVSEDKNRFSAWSPIATVTAFDLENLPGRVDGDMTILGNSIFITWDDALDRPKYDIFVSFDEGDYFYHGTSPTHSYSVLNNTGAAIIDVVIQIESINKELSEVLIICELSGIIES